MLFTSAVIGLLSLAASPMQGLVDARPMSKAASAVQARAVEFDWDTPPKIKLSDVAGASIGDIKRLPASNDAMTSIYGNDWFVILREEDDDLETELKVYKAIDGQEIAPPVAALIVEDDDDEKVVGLATAFIDGGRPTADDRQAADDLMTKLHDAGFAHTDPHKWNWIKADKLYLIDFEGAVEGPSDEQKNQDFQAIKDHIGGDAPAKTVGGGEEDDDLIDLPIIGDIIDGITKN